MLQSCKKFCRVYELTQVKSQKQVSSVTKKKINRPLHAQADPYCKDCMNHETMEYYLLWSWTRGICNMWDKRTATDRRNGVYVVICTQCGYIFYLKNVKFKTSENYRCVISGGTLRKVKAHIMDGKIFFILRDTYVLRDCACGNAQWKLLLLYASPLASLAYKPPSASMYKII